MKLKVTGTFREPKPQSELEYHLVLLLQERQKENKKKEREGEKESLSEHISLYVHCVSASTLRSVSCKIDRMRGRHERNKEKKNT